MEQGDPRGPAGGRAWQGARCSLHAVQDGLNFLHLLGTRRCSVHMARAFSITYYVRLAFFYQVLKYLLFGGS